MPQKNKYQQANRTEIMNRTDGMITRVREISQGWFGFAIDDTDKRGSFKGMATWDICTKGAHFILLKNMLPQGSNILTTEQEATLPRFLRHIFDEEIRENRFAWLAMSFNRKATRPEKLRKVKSYRKERKQFHSDGMFAGRFDPESDPQMITDAFIADGLKPALRGTASPFQISNYRSGTFPSLWVRSPTEACGEIGEVVGLPIVPGPLRHTLKCLPFNEATLSPDPRPEIAPWIHKSTL